MGLNPYSTGNEVVAAEPIGVVEMNGVCLNPYSTGNEVVALVKKQQNIINNIVLILILLEMRLLLGFQRRKYT